MQQYHPHIVRIPSTTHQHPNARMVPILLANFISNALAPRSPPRRMPPPGRVRKGRAKPINLALQGGGAHGAFTWGVLDQLLEDGRIAIEGISGASAGAVNAAMPADGLNPGGPDEARQRLRPFLAPGHRRRPLRNLSPP